MDYNCDLVVYPDSSMTRLHPKEMVDGVLCVFNDLGYLRQGGDDDLAVQEGVSEVFIEDADEQDVNLGDCSCLSIPSRSLSGKITNLVPAGYGMADEPAYPSIEVTGFPRAIKLEDGMSEHPFASSWLAIAFLYGGRTLDWDSFSFSHHWDPLDAVLSELFGAPVKKTFVNYE